MQHLHPLDSDNAIADETSVFQEHWSKTIPFRRILSIGLAVASVIALGIGCLALLDTYRRWKNFYDDPWFQRVILEELILLVGIFLAAIALFVLAIYIYPQRIERRYGEDDFPLDTMIPLQIRFWRAATILVSFVSLSLAGAVFLSYFSSRSMETPQTTIMEAPMEEEFMIADSTVMVEPPTEDNSGQ